MDDIMRKTAVVATILMMLAVGISAAPSAEADSSTTYGDFLVDYGNGNTQWVNTMSASTVSDTVKMTLSTAGISCTISGATVTVAGIAAVTTGAASTGGSLSVSGTTGITVDCSWHIYSWDDANSKWTVLDSSHYGDAYSSGKLAVGYYPDGMAPTENPKYKAAWTMFGGDAENSFNQTVGDLDTKASQAWEYHSTATQDSPGCYCGALYADGMFLVKTGGKLTAYNASSGETVWEFTYASGQIEMACPVIAGSMVYIPTTKYVVYGFDIHDGPGEGNVNVIVSDTIPEKTAELEYHATYGAGATAIVYDAGCLYAKARNGMIYCWNTSLQLVWSYQMGGEAYFSPLTVMDGYVFAGTYDGCLYILNKADGTLIHKEVVFQTVDSHDNPVGGCNVPVLVRTAEGYAVFATYNDGSGMNNTVNSLMVYSFNTSTNALTKVKDFMDDTAMGRTHNAVTRYVTDNFKGVLVGTTTGIFTVNTSGEAALLNSVVGGINDPHAPLTLVNNSTIYASTYSTRQMYTVNTSGTTIGVHSFDNKWYAMAPVTVVDGYLVRCDDNGVTGFTGTVLAAYVPPDYTPPMQLWEMILIALAAVAIAVALMWAVLRFGLKWEKPFAELRHRIMVYFYGENYSHNTKSKRKLHLVILVGVTVTLVAAIASLCIGSKTTLGVGEALSATFSAIGKGGHGLTYEEMLIYNQRLPRTLATIAVGIGLSVAGAMYQAVIKNPLVEPYIMGVSSGAGTMAVAVMLSGFTFFGLVSAQSPYLIALSAIVGGLLAFGCTMLMAEKTGGKSINYVLAGIVVGLVFSAIQSILMIRSGTKMSNALSWLYGSFTNVTWETLWLVLIPCIMLSFVPLIWAKELNLVLLGEDQAMQMGLDAKKFDRWMLIIASVLTSFCVAFCGIIGFVGLVIPHVARMILGGDHRLMLPVSMAFGGLLMIISDLLSRVLLTGYELPVGAITTMIGVPVFAYLLIRSGGRYDA